MSWTRSALVGLLAVGAVVSVEAEESTYTDANGVTYERPSAPPWLPTEVPTLSETAKRQTVYQNPQNLNTNALNQGFQEGSRPLQDAARDIGQWGSTTAKDLGQGTHSALQGAFNGVSDTLTASGQAIGNAVENTINIGDERYYQQRQQGAANTVQPPQPIASQFSTPLTQPAGQAQAPGIAQTSGQTGPAFAAPGPATDQFAQQGNGGTVTNSSPPPIATQFSAPDLSTQHSAAFSSTNPTEAFAQGRPSRLEPIRPISQPQQFAAQPQQPQPAPNYQQPQNQQLYTSFSAPPTAQTAQQPQQQYYQPPSQPIAGQAGQPTQPMTVAQQGQQQNQVTPALQNWDPNAVKFAQNNEQQETPVQAGIDSKLVTLGLGLVCSLALNLFVGTSYLDVRNKYRSALRRSPRDFRTVAA